MVPAEGLDAGVDILPGGLRAETQADNPGGSPLGQAQGGHHMAGFALVTGGTCGDADILGPKIVDDVLAGPAPQGRRQDMGRPAGALGHALELGAAFPPPDHPLNIEEMDGLAARLADDPEGLRRVLDRAAAANADGRWQSLAWARSLALAAVQSFDWADAAPGGVELARTFARVESAFLAACYAPEVFQGEALRVLPPMHRFGWHCARAFDALEAGDPLGYVRLLRAGLETAPEMKLMVEFLTKHTPELQAPPPSPELRALAEQVRTMLAAYDPEDPAVQAIKANPVYQRVAYLIEGDNT